jgi:hypothetical protein
MPALSLLRKNVYIKQRKTTLLISFLVVTFLDLIFRVCSIVSHDFNLDNSCTDIKQRVQCPEEGGGGWRQFYDFRMKEEIANVSEALS